MPYDTKALIESLEAIGHKPKKSLGQNFLVNEDVSHNIASWVDRHPKELIIEVGPGLGALTEKIVQLGTSFKVVELDTQFSQYWRDKGVNVIEGDALKCDWAELTEHKQTTLVSNLPYQISSRLVVDRSILPTGVDRMILMFQKEVAERIVADKDSKVYGLLSVIAQSYWSIRKFCDVGPKDFYPPPQVGSRVLTFIKIEPKIENGEKYLTFLKAAFSQRRKKLFNNLGQFAQKERIRVAFDELGFNENIRAENLSVDDFQNLFKVLVN